MNLKIKYHASGPHKRLWTVKDADTNVVIFTGTTITEAYSYAKAVKEGLIDVDASSISCNFCTSPKNLLEVSLDGEPTEMFI